jgi:hypothetical protein
MPLGVPSRPIFESHPVTVSVRRATVRQGTAEQNGPTRREADGCSHETPARSAVVGGALASPAMADLDELEAIKALKSRYARAADACLRSPGEGHEAALADLFTDDAEVDYGPFGRFRGRSELLDAFGSVIPAAVSWSTHCMLNPLLSLETASTASGSWYFVIHSKPRQPADAPVTTFYGSYDERYRKEPGGWRIASLTAIYSMP